MTEKGFSDLACREEEDDMTGGLSPPKRNSALPNLEVQGSYNQARTVLMTQIEPGQFYLRSF